MTDKYILMCRQAKEIQEAWEPKEGDMTYVLLANQQLRLSVADIEMVPIFNDYIWLPHIEDLVEMMKKYGLNASAYGITVAHHEYLFSKQNSIFGVTYKESWLCFVMHEIYNKSWNGEDWEPVK